MKKYVSFCEKINKILITIGIIFLFFATGLTFVQVLLRNTIQYSFPWAEELTRYVIIFAVYFASGTVFLIDANARVDIFYNMFPKKVRCIFNCLFYVLITIFLLIMLYYGYVYVSNNMKVWCASIHIPWAVPFSSLILGAVNMLIQVPAKLYLTIKDMNSPEAEQA